MSEIVIKLSREEMQELAPKMRRLSQRLLQAFPSMYVVAPAVLVPELRRAMAAEEERVERWLRVVMWQNEKTNQQNMKREPRSVVQPWVAELTMMQQTVLLTAVRGPDGLRKECPAKAVLRAYRRVILLSAMDGKALDAFEPGGGSFTGPCTHSKGLVGVMQDFVRSVDELPHHFIMHLVHAVEIVGYKHPDASVSCWWNAFYQSLVKSLHMNPETEEEMDFRLGDSREQWIAAQQLEIGEVVQ